MARWLVVSFVLLASDALAQSWTPQSSGTTNDLRGLHFVDATHGWAVGLNGTILHTTDGGENWSPQNPGTSGVHNYFAVRFLDRNLGWAGGGYVVSRTTNGGSSWGGLEFTAQPPFRNDLF